MVIVFIVLFIYFQMKIYQKIIKQKNKMLFTIFINNFQKNNIIELQIKKQKMDVQKEDQIYY